MREKFARNKTLNEKEFGQWIKSLRAPHITRVAMAKKYECHPNTLKSYENSGRLPDVDYLLALSNETGYDFKELTKQRVIARFSSTNTLDLKTVLQVCEGSTDYSAPHLPPLHHDWTAEGNTMDPTIKDGARVVYDGSDTELSDGQMYMIKINETQCIRRVQITIDGGINLLCDNNSYPAQSLPKEKASMIEVLGRVTSITNQY